MEKFLYSLEGKTEIHFQSQLWYRWTYGVNYQVISIAPLGLNASLLYLYFRDNPIGKNMLSEHGNEPMTTNQPEIPPALKSLTQTLDPAVSLLIENLTSRLDKFESGDENKKVDDHIARLEEKLENFRGMIARRDARIQKLEAKANRK